MGQEFSPTLYAVDTVEMWIADASCSGTNPKGGAVQLRLRESTIFGPVLGTSQIIYFTNCFDGVKQFNFPAFIPLTPDAVYVIEPFVPEGHYFYIAMAAGFEGPDAYDRGRQIINGVPYAMKDLWFREGIYQFVAETKEQCKKGGWQGLVRTDGTPFKNQGDCIQFVNTGK